ncbi:MAG: hypothetical protein IJY14_00960 [Acholeplasmatales bacterium]|nr:hypothetical protein [Acholeplasmatales bacterium]
MKKRIISSFLILFCMIFVAGCSTNDDVNKSDANTSKYSIKVTDIDGEEIGYKEININAYDTLIDALNAEFEVVSTNSEWGTTLISINSSITDPNYYLAIYENGEYALTGVDGLIIDANDSFEFVVECFNTIESGYGTLDEYDLLVDKLIYNYAKNYMQDSLSNSNSYTDSIYWDMMSINLMLSFSYDKNAFNTNSVTNEFINSLNNTDFSTLDGANIGKYYYAASALNLDLNEFKSFYEDYITNTISEEYSEWTMPFIMSPAKKLGLTSDKLNALINTDYLAATTWGIDGIAWQATSLQLFDKYNTDILINFPAADYGNGASTALALLPYAALNENVRDSKYEQNSSDLIEILIDNYYDEELCLLKYSKNDTAVNMSTNQIYAALMAYKAQRDYNKAANIFA